MKHEQPFFENISRVTLCSLLDGAVRRLLSGDADNVLRGANYIDVRDALVKVGHDDDGPALMDELRERLAAAERTWRDLHPGQPFPAAVGGEEGRWMTNVICAAWRDVLVERGVVAAESEFWREPA